MDYILKLKLVDKNKLTVPSPLAIAYTAKINNDFALFSTPNKVLYEECIKRLRMHSVWFEFATNNNTPQ